MVLIPWLLREPIPEYFIFGPGRETNVVQRIVHHSPTGLNWGYMGSGPHDTALNILALYLPEGPARALHGLFCRDVISRIPSYPVDRRLIPRTYVERWICDHYPSERSV